MGARGLPPRLEAPERLSRARGAPPEVLRGARCRLGAADPLRRDDDPGQGGVGKRDLPDRPLTRRAGRRDARPATAPCGARALALAQCRRGARALMLRLGYSLALGTWSVA